MLDTRLTLEALLELTFQILFLYITGRNDPVSLNNPRWGCPSPRTNQAARTLIPLQSLIIPTLIRRPNLPSAL
jgi:hypothetical protein